MQQENEVDYHKQRIQWNAPGFCLQHSKLFHHGAPLQSQHNLDGESWNEHNLTNQFEKNWNWNRKSKENLGFSLNWGHGDAKIVWRMSWGTWNWNRRWKTLTLCESERESEWECCVRSFSQFLKRHQEWVYTQSSLFIGQP